MNRKLIYYFLILILLLIDQVTKILVVRKIALSRSVEIIPGFFNLSHTRNRGAIFGLFSQSESGLLYIFLMLASLVAFCLVVFYFFKTPSTEKLLKISLSLILAGALGNLTDRILRGYVIDFMDFYVKKWHWPFFNIADSCITIGAFFLIFIFFFKEKPKCFLS